MQSISPTTVTSPTSTVRIVGNVSELDEDSVGDNRRSESERRSILSSSQKKRRGSSGTNKQVNVKASADENLELFVKTSKKYLKNDDHSLPINFREVDRQWRGVEEKHQSISKKYEVDGVSTTLKAIKEHLDSENRGEVMKTSIPLRVRHRFWKDLSHLDDCNTRFVLIEKNLVRAEKQKKDLRKEEEQQIAVGYRFRMFGKAKLVKPKISSGQSLLLPSPVAALRGIKKTPEKSTRQIPVLEMDESVIDLPYDLSLGEYLAYVREKKHEELASDPPSTDRSEVASPKTPVQDPGSVNGTPRSKLTKRKTEPKVIEKPDICFKPPSLFDQVVNIDIKTREQIEKEVSKKHKEKLRQYGHYGHSRNNHEVSLSHIPSVFQSLSAINNRLNNGNSRESPPLSITPDEDLLRRKRSELGLLKNTNISQLDAHHPLFYVFRIRLVNFSTSEYKLLKTRFNISISQLRSPHYIHIDTFNSNLFVTLYNQPVNELGYIVPEYHSDDCIFACVECLPWLNESTVKSVLNQHLRITIHDCQDLSFPVFDFIVSFSEKERLFIVSHHLIDAPHAHQPSESSQMYSEREAKYDFLKKPKLQPKQDVEEHLQKHDQPRQFLFVTFGDKDSSSTNRFDLKYTPTINLVSYPKKSYLAHRNVSPTRSIFKSPEKKKEVVADVNYDDYELRNLEVITPSPFKDVHEETLSSVGTEDQHHIKLPKSRDTKRYYDFSKSKKAIPYVSSYKSSDINTELVAPDNPSIKTANVPTMFYSHETNKTVMLTSGKDKNVRVILPPKRIPHNALPVVDARAPLPKPVRFGALDNTQKILREQRLIFKEQQKSGALGMIDFNNFDEIRKGAPSTDCIAVGDRKLSVALEH